jgi:hypothetical protein
VDPFIWQPFDFGLMEADFSFGVKNIRVVGAVNFNQRPHENRRLVPDDRPVANNEAPDAGESPLDSFHTCLGELKWLISC